MPPTRHRQNPLRPAWLKATPLGRDLALAIRAAERLNALFDRWRGRGGSEFEELCQAYLSSRRFLRLKPRTKHDYEAMLRDLQRPEHFGGALLREITPEAIDAFRDMLERQGMGAASVDYRLKVLRLLFTWAIKARRHVGANPATGVIDRVYKPRRQVWDRPQVAAALALPYPSGLAAYLALFTLQRQGDVLAMRWEDIKDGTIRVVQGKGDALLFLPIHPRLQAALDDAPRRGEWLLASRTGGRYRDDGFRAVWRRHKATIPGAAACTFHDLRRTATSWLLGAGLGDDEVRLWTGHRRQGGDRILDVYDVRLRNLAERSFPAMDDWGTVPESNKSLTG